jgi:hypothetical protein
MTENDIWNCETPVAELLDCDVPDWIEQDIAASTIASICQGGCNSGAYMPAVTYHQALRTMGDYGDDVLAYIDGQLDELPAPQAGESWSGLACFYLSCAVELWAGGIMGQLEELEIEGA